MKIYIARDEDGELWFYREKPGTDYDMAGKLFYYQSESSDEGESDEGETAIPLDPSFYPEIKPGECFDAEIELGSKEEIE